MTLIRIKTESMTSSDTIAFAAKNIILIKVMGYLSITIVDGKSVTKFLDVVYMLFGIFFGISMCYVAVLKREELGVSNSSIADTGNFVGFIGSVFVSIVVMLANFLVRHKSWDILVKLAKMQDKFSSINFPVNYNNSEKIHILCGILLQFLMIPLAVWTYFTEGSLIKIFLSLYAGVNFTVGVGSMTVYVMGISNRLTTMSQILKGDTNDKILCTLAKVYQEIIEVCDEMNVCYSLQVMSGFGMSLLYTLFTMFTAYTDFVVAGHLTAVTISSIGFTIYYNIVLLAVIVTCNLTNRKAENVTKILKNLLKEHHSHRSLKSSILRTFSILLMKRQPRLSCGLFDYDWELVYAVIATTSSNFVILMQFDLAQRRKHFNRDDL